MRALDRGEEFIVTRNGKPVGELRPIRPRQFVPTATFLAIMEDAPRIDWQRFRADLDAFADQDSPPDPWRES